MKTPNEIKRGLECCRGGELGCSECPYDGECHLPFANGPEADAIAYIKQLEAKVPKWISVKERLPKRGYKVLTVNGHGYIRIFALWKKTEREWCWIDDAGHFNHVNDITHWMPMPEPPKEEA